MTPEQAHEILTELFGEAPSSEKLNYLGPAVVLSYGDGSDVIRLDGEFTAEQLNAIALWMENPLGVTSCD